ncbi:PREDICTED: putative RNA polymerase II subunit B1 CTD phosphatase RPAP2 [Dinoponera quadriceps]|uniref:RNA polymerase II subunit B1 CTD phosphatase RPAP2 homolog n=1 Tax=Dinoponera quadriceps TaxID=609295 RepID=A0A6P3XRK0_DINQU|nr:PREDICTED: putative RNA polymerase II subunit B1 CTD phosphatase RPAP2 [Dinoponera quadriceps]
MMSAIKRQSNEKVKVRKKMSKVEIYQAIIRKKRCDTKALAIVEQLLETNVNPDWLIQNLKFINKTHMEDVIEERSIIKLCGYVLCSKPLTAVVKQQYRISTRTNKVYDISKRKNFCSSSCYGASNYLLEQMLESPLWLREKEHIPVFTILPINSVYSLPGDEIDVVGVNLLQNTDTNDIDNNKELNVEFDAIKQTENNLSPTKSRSEMENDSHSSNNRNVEEHTQIDETSVNIDTQNFCEAHPSELCTTTQKDKEQNPQECHENRYNDHVQQENMKAEDQETHTAVQLNNTLHIHERVNRNAKNENANSRIVRSNSVIEVLQPELDEISNNKNDSSKMLQSQLDEVNNSSNVKDGKIMQFQLNKARSYQNITISSKHRGKHKENKSKRERIRDANKNKNERKQEEFDNTEVQASVYHNLVMHVEQSFREWVTESTFCLLLGEMDEKSQLWKNLMKQDRYEQLCKKLNRLQLQDEKESRVDLGKNVLKPLPNLSVLQEEGKKMELKVHAFYEGQLTITEDSSESKNRDEGEDKEPILPLTDAYAPNALRRRIFLNKLSQVLPDLLCALTRLPANASTSSVSQHIYDNETYSLIKLLVRTFHLTATNIVFKTAEWTLVGLIIIKMLSLVGTQLQTLLETKQASMYTSMILMSYKLDSGYLDRLIVSVINNKNT